MKQKRKNGYKIRLKRKQTAQKKRSPVRHAENRAKKFDRIAKDSFSFPDIIYQKAVFDYELEEEFSPSAIDEARERARATITKNTLKKREDLRDMTIFTIDGIDACDYDDAVSIELLEDITRLGVHIADVSAYVSSGGEINKEAYARGTSVYMPGRVIPMLPDDLSTNMCSLNPDVDRLTISLFMDIDNEGNVVDYRYSSAVICSKARLCYEDLNKMFAGDASQRRAMEAAGLLEPLEKMVELADILRKKRKRRGALDFDLPEAYIELDDDGNPVNIMVREHGVSNALIEEFMLLANEVTAEHARKYDLPFIYRVHEQPSSDKIEEFSIFINNYGYKLPRKVSPKSLQRLLSKIHGKPGEAVISHLLLKSLQKARYDTEPIGHFGLATADYCHFTSPIRRYPDLFVHRILRKHIDGHLKEKEKAKLKKRLPEIAAQSSSRERAAMEAERDVESALKALYMSRHIGESYDGVISGINMYGFYVMLENSVEGFVHVMKLPVFLRYDKFTNSLSDKHAEYVFRIGDVVRVRVLSTDTMLRRVDFLLEGTFGIEMYRNAVEQKPAIYELLGNPVFLAMFEPRL